MNISHLIYAFSLLLSGGALSVDFYAEIDLINESSADEVSFGKQIMMKSIQNIYGFYENYKQNR